MKGNDERYSVRPGKYLSNDSNSNWAVIIQLTANEMNEQYYVSPKVLFFCQ